MVKIKQKIGEIWKKCANHIVIQRITIFWKTYKLYNLLLIAASIAIFYYLFFKNIPFNTVLFILLLFSSFLLTIFNIIFSEQKNWNLFATTILGIIITSLTFKFHKDEEIKLKQKEDLIRLKEIVKEDLIPKFEQIHLSIHMRYHIFEGTKDSKLANLELAKIINYAHFFQKEAFPKLDTAKKVLEKTLNEFPEIKSTLNNYADLLHRVIPQDLNQFKNMLLVYNLGDNTYGESKEFDQLDSLDSQLLKLIESKID